MEGFEAWYERERPRVLGACAALSGDIDLAAEATDEAFVRACERWGRVGRLDAPGAWVQVVALNVVRRRSRRRPPHPEVAASAHPPELPEQELWEAVRALPDRQRLAVVLRYVGDLPEAQIAAAMGVSRGTVASTLSDARARLRAVLATPIDDEEEIRG